jgi:hypothetical protein
MSIRIEDANRNFYSRPVFSLILVLPTAVSMIGIA